MEELRLDQSQSKEDMYVSLLPQISALLEGESDTIANLANICGALKQAFNWWWIGFYIIKDNELVLGPYQGPVACTRIAFGRGVCGTSWQQKQSIIVPDVDQFPGHITCSAESRSEIVIPVFSNNTIVAVLDVDSELFNHFDDTDKKYLEEIVSLVSF